MQAIDLTSAQVVENLSVERNICFATCLLILVKKDIHVISAVKHSVEKIICINTVKFTDSMVHMNANYAVSFNSWLLLIVIETNKPVLCITWYESVGKSFIVQHYFLMHKANHGNAEMEEFQFQCDICKKGFVKEEFLNRHKVRHRVRNPPHVSRHFVWNIFYYSVILRMKQKYFRIQTMNRNLRLF